MRLQINVHHRHFGHSVTFQESIKLVTRAVRRILGDAREQKLPITPDILRRICPLLSADIAFRPPLLSAFIHFSASQISLSPSNLVPKSAQDYDSSKTDFFQYPPMGTGNLVTQPASFVDTRGSPASGPPLIPSTSLWTPSALPPGSILLGSLPQVLWRRHQAHNVLRAWFEITLCSRLLWPRPLQILDVALLFPANNIEILSIVVVYLIMWLHYKFNYTGVFVISGLSVVLWTMYWQGISIHISVKTVSRKPGLILSFKFVRIAFPFKSHSLG